jgi:isopenicillin N synthase-like dioxygenase
MRLLMPSNFKSLPVVDVSSLYSADWTARQRVADEIGAASRESGFLYIVGHPIKSETRERLLDVSKTFFARPAAEKMKTYIGHSTSHSGYVPPGEEVFYGQKPDRKEAFDVSLDVPACDPEVLSGRTPLLGPVQWPDDAEFKAAVSAYYSDVANLARTLFRGFALALELPEDYYEAYLKRPPSQLRLIHYPYAADAPADEPGIGAHTDYECFTILWPTAPGLEVMNGAGEWIDAPPIDGGFVINIGDMLEAWTNGTFVATSHRVRKVSEERYAFPYFAACDYHTVVKPLPQFVTTDRKPKFEPLVAGDHLLAQTALTFQYLKKRIEAGTFTLPEGARKLSSFGQEAIHAGSTR